MHSLCLLWSFLGLRCCSLITVIIIILLTSCLLFWIDDVLLCCRLLCLCKLRSLARYHHKVCLSQLFNQHTISINLICKYQLHACINYPFGGMGSKGEISRRKPSLRKIQSSASVHQPSKPAPASQPVCHIYHLQRCAVERSDSVHSQLPAIK